jgi:hypothetical protein
MATATLKSAQSDPVRQKKEAKKLPAPPLIRIITVTPEHKIMAVPKRRVDLAVSPAPIDPERYRAIAVPNPRSSRLQYLPKDPTTVQIP